MNGKRGIWERFSLYGDEWSSIAPEFVHIEPVSSRSSLHDWNIGAHSHPGMHQLLLLEMGAGRLAVDDREMQLTAPALVAVPSLSVHAFVFEPGSEGWVISFAVDLLHDPRMTAAGKSSLFLRSPAVQAGLEPGSQELARIAWLMADMAARQADPSTGQLTAIDVAQLCLLLTCADSALVHGTASSGADRQQRLAERFRLLVDENYRRGWTIAHYADQLATTEQTLTRACRAMFGNSPRTIVQERLAVEAMRYLKFSEASMKEISSMLGFSDPAYFARFFRKMTGETATQFRFGNTPTPAITHNDMAM